MSSFTQVGLQNAATGYPAISVNKILQSSAREGRERQPPYPEHADRGLRLLNQNFTRNPYLEEWINGRNLFLYI
jgi:hypothetical protein